MSNVWAYSFWSLGPFLQEYGVILPLGAFKAPKNGKMCPKIGDVNDFRYLRGHLVAIWAQILVEQVIGFDMSTQTSKSDKN